MVSVVLTQISTFAWLMMVIKFFILHQTHLTSFCYVDKSTFIKTITGNSARMYTNGMFKKFVAFFKTSIDKKVFRFLRFIDSDRVQQNRIHAYHFPAQIVCVIQMDVNNNIIESSQIIRDCLLKEPICECSFEC